MTNAKFLCECNQTQQVVKKCKYPQNFDHPSNNFVSTSEKKLIRYDTVAIGYKT